MDRSKWEYKKLGEVCAPKSDILRANKLFGNDDIIDYVDISSIDNTTHSITQPTSYVFKEAPSRAQQKVEQGDILYSLVRPNLKNIAVVTSSDTDKYVASSGFCVLRGKDVETRYLYHMVLGDAFTNYILGLVSGANYPAVREDDVKGFSFRCPPIADQKRIVAELDCLNEMIALKQEQLKEFDKLAQSIFYDMFGGDTYSKLELASLYEFIDYRGKTPNKIKAGIPLITARNIRFGYLDYSVQEYISEDEFETRQSRGIAKKGDLLFTTEAPMGFAAIADLDVFSTGQRVITFQLKNGVHINNLYMLYYLMSEEFQQILLNNATGVTVKGIKAAKLKRIKVSIPPLALQQQFAEKIQAIEAQKELVKQSIAETQQLLDSRMDYFFN